MCEMYENKEDILEQASLEWLEETGYQTMNGRDLTVGGNDADRKDYQEVVLTKRLRSALCHLNSDFSLDVIEEAIHKITVPEHPDMMVNNRRFHSYVMNGIDIETREGDRNTTKRVRLFDFDIPANNDFLAVNQFNIREGEIMKRPDIILFVNGLPIVIFELKKVGEGAMSKAFTQLQNYKEAIPTVFTYNEFLIISDSVNAKAGTVTSNEERFMVWRTMDGHIENETQRPQLEVLIKGMCDPVVLLDLMRHFILFKDDGNKATKMLAAYHQYHAVNRAIDEAKRAVSNDGDNKIGVVWHTQGSGKSLTMVFYTAKLVQALDNPTIVVLTDRNDLDDQLFLTFSQSSELLRTIPKQAETRDELRELLLVNAGGIVFSTMQKFGNESGEIMPTLTDRRNVIVMADEAHRSQYGLSADMNNPNSRVRYGYAKYVRDALPNASYIGFTGTPIAKTDKSTRAIFGNYIDVYDMTQSVEDGATVPIYYESRIIFVSKMDDPAIDDNVNLILEEQEEYVVSNSKSKWSSLNAIAGTESRLKILANDFVDHFETRQRASFGKSMIVVASRSNAIDLYEKIVTLRPDWHSEENSAGKIKIVMTGSSSDPTEWQPFIGTKATREKLANRMKDELDPLQIVIVVDMWLTGFDVPSLNTMYIDKTMESHNLMQAIARVNRVFKDKTGGLVVDYIGIADNLKEAMKEYTPSDRQQAGIDTHAVVNLLLEKYSLIKELLHGYDYSLFDSNKAAVRVNTVNRTMDFILGKGKEETKRFRDTVQELARTFSLCATEAEARRINEEVGFFKAVKKSLESINVAGTRKSSRQVDAELKQLVSKSVISEEVVDIYQTLGIEKPDLSILSPEFLEEVRILPEKNVAIALLDRLLEGKVKAIKRTNIVQARKFSELLEVAIEKYNRRSIETAKVIEELIELAKDMNQAQQRGEVGLSLEETAFYDALTDHNTAKDVLGDDTLKLIAHELTKAIKANMSIDWNLKESARAQMRKVVKRLLRKYGYPPDIQEDAVKVVVNQAELMAGNIDFDGELI